MKKIFLKIKYFFLFLYKKIKYKWENIERDDNFWFLHNVLGTELVNLLHNDVFSIYKVSLICNR